MTPLEAQRARALASTVAFRQRHDGIGHALEMVAALRGAS